MVVVVLVVVVGGRQNFFPQTDVQYKTKNGNFRFEFRDTVKIL
jgi:hypothetical protein